MEKKVWKIFFFNQFSRSLFLNNVLNGLNTLVIDDESSLRSAVYETYILNKNTVFDNFNVNLELWNKSEQKLKDFFVFSC